MILFLTNLVHTNQHIPLTLYGVKIWCILPESSMHGFSLQYKPNKILFKKKRYKVYQHKFPFFSQLDFTLKSLLSQNYGVFYLNNVVTMHVLALLVQLKLYS